MDRYTAGWWRAFLWSVTCGACLAMVDPAPVTRIVVATGSVAVTAVSIQLLRARSSPLLQRADLPGDGELALTLGLGVVALVGLGHWVPFLAVWLPIVLAATSPPVAAAVRARLGRHLPGRPADGSGADAAAAVVDRVATVDVPRLRGLTDRDLCHAWRASFLLLQRAPGPVAVARVVALRQAYLDELERRDARGLRAWLASGARAAGGPDRFLRFERLNGAG